MKTMIYLLVCLCLIEATLEQCFTENPGSVEECESKNKVVQSAVM